MPVCRHEFELYSYLPDRYGRIGCKRVVCRACGQFVGYWFEPETKREKVKRKTESIVQERELYS